MLHDERRRWSRPPTLSLLQATARPCGSCSTIAATAWLARRTRLHANEAEDIVQDALAQAIQRLDQFTWHGWAAFQGWMWAFVENAHADRLKYHARDCRDQRRVVEDVSPPEMDTSQVGLLTGVAGREETPSRQARRRSATVPAAGDARRADGRSTPCHRVALL